jgi:hypothetical protein
VELERWRRYGASRVAGVAGAAGGPVPVSGSFTVIRDGVSGIPAKGLYLLGFEYDGADIAGFRSRASSAVQLGFLGRM